MAASTERAVDVDIRGALPLPRRTTEIPGAREVGRALASDPLAVCAVTAHAGAREDRLARIARGPGHLGERRRGQDFRRIGGRRERARVGERRRALARDQQGEQRDQSHAVPSAPRWQRRQVRPFLARNVLPRVLLAHRAGAVDRLA